LAFDGAQQQKIMMMRIAREIAPSGDHDDAR
jgi:hypothetical protein